MARGLQRVRARNKQEDALLLFNVVMLLFLVPCYHCCGCFALNFLWNHVWRYRGLPVEMIRLLHLSAVGAWMRTNQRFNREVIWLNSVACERSSLFTLLSVKTACGNTFTSKTCCIQLQFWVLLCALSLIPVLEIQQGPIPYRIKLMLFYTFYPQQIP